MRISQIERVAQQVVEATSPLVGGRTINIMDVEGIILASSDAKRIGTFHQGAAQVVQSGKTVRIQSNEVSLYAGAREGINLPILRGGKILGVVGIFGDPAEVEEAANLLGVCVGLYLDQEIETQRRQRQKNIRCALLKMLLFNDQCNESELIASGYDLQSMRSPVKVIALSLPPEVCREERIRILDQVESMCIKHEIVRESQDIYGVISERFVFVARSKRNTEHLYSLLYTTVKQPFSLAEGRSCERWEEIKLSYREAITLGRLIPRAYGNLEEKRYQLLYSMDGALAQIQRRIIKPMYDTVIDCFGGKDIGWIMETMRAYYEYGGSAMRAAQQLHIHKNTLLYRVRKIIALLDLEEEDAFTREYFLRLLLLYYDNKNTTGE